MKPGRAVRRPPDSRQVAVDILLRVEGAGAWASVLLDHAERQLRDSRDAALVHELVLGVLRRQAWLDHVLSRLASRPPETMDRPVRIALRIGAYCLLYLDRVPDFAAVDRSVELVRHHERGRATGFVNGVLRRLALEREACRPGEVEPGDVASLAQVHSHPRWWVERVVDRIGWSDAESLLEANNRPVATVLRPNLRRTSLERLCERLERAGVATERCSFVEQALRVTSGSLRASGVLADGSAWVQDQASQLVGDLVGRGPFGRAIDLCAAPGGKTMQLAERVAAGGLLIAVDRHAGRLRRLRRNLETTGVEPTAIVQADMRAGRQPFDAPFDRVLLDAPCSGTGTMRRHPEIRWRLEVDSLKLLAVRQASLLEAAAGLVAPGGRLVYSVCSMEPEEGEAVIDPFLARQPQFRLSDPRGDWPASRTGCVDARGFVRTGPRDDAMDGFFAACLERTGA